MLAYRAPAILFTNHLETIYPALFRTVNGVVYSRERISTPDQDFLDLDWIINESDKLIIISHGLEGNSQRAYLKGMAKIFSLHGYDVLAWNYRGCSEEMNRQLRFYHSGATDDLNLVVEHALTKGYSEINLIGFSNARSRRARSARVMPAIMTGRTKLLNTSTALKMASAPLSAPASGIVAGIARGAASASASQSAAKFGAGVDGIAAASRGAGKLSPWRKAAAKPTIVSGDGPASVVNPFCAARNSAARLRKAPTES